MFVLWCFQDTIIDLFRDIAHLKEDLRDVVGMSVGSIDALLEIPLPENRTEVNVPSRMSPFVRLSRAGPGASL